MMKVIDNSRLVCPGAGTEFVFFSLGLHSDRPRSFTDSPLTILPSFTEFYRVSGKLIQFHHSSAGGTEFNRIGPKSLWFYRVWPSLTECHRVTPGVTKVWFCQCDFLPSRTEFLPSLTEFGRVQGKLVRSHRGLPGQTEFHRLSPSFTEFYRVEPSRLEFKESFHRVSVELSFTELYRVWLTFYPVWSGFRLNILESILFSRVATGSFFYWN